MTTELALKPYEYRDPGQVLTDVLTGRRLRAGDAVLALVRAPSTEQRVLRAVKVRQPEHHWDEWAWAEELSDAVRRLRVPKWRGSPRHSIMTVVARSGLAVFGRYELPWMTAWRYNHDFVDAYKGELTLLTEHGWVDFMTDLGARTPCL